ncbi:MAG: aldo/keto reductase [Gaiellaceae bacterium]
MPAETISIGRELEVRRLGFGAMRITGSGVWGPPADRDRALAVLRRAVELGVQLIDTADSYGPEISEELIAAALHPYPDDLVIATKGGLVRPGPGRWDPDGRPEHLRAACEGSLRRLRLERIDLYQLHRVDPKVPLEESLGTLRELQLQGKIRFIGISNVSPRELEQAERSVEIVSVQNRYNDSDRDSEDVLQACETRGIPFIPWFPLGAGSASSPVDSLVWLLRHSPVLLPIPGTSSVAHLEENMRAADLA